MSKFLRKLAKKELLTPHLDAYFKKAEFPDKFNFEITPNKEPDNNFHPSGDCTPCERSLFAKFTGESSDRGLTASSHKNFMVGHFWHILLQTIITDELKFSEWGDVERKLKWRGPNWTVLGSADISHVYLPGHALPFLVDFKTMNKRVFDEDVVPEYILDKWRHQVNIYMDLTRYVSVSDDKPYPKQAIIIVIEKDTPHKFKEVVIDYDRDLCDRVYEKWDVVTKAIQKDFPPRCECPIGKCPVEVLYTRV